MICSRRKLRLQKAASISSIPTPQQVAPAEADGEEEDPDRVADLARRAARAKMMRTFKRPCLKLESQSDLIRLASSSYLLITMKVRTFLQLSSRKPSRRSGVTRMTSSKSNTEALPGW